MSKRYLYEFCLDAEYLIKLLIFFKKVVCQEKSLFRVAITKRSYILYYVIYILFIDVFCIFSKIHLRVLHALSGCLLVERVGAARGK